MSLPEAIDSMEVAGTVDLRGTQVLPLLLQVVGTPSDPQLAAAVAVLQDWVDSGAHRIDRDQDGQYDHTNAVQIMDAWWPRLLEAEFEPEMGTAFFDAVHGVHAFDNEPNNHGEHLGSAYQDGWWGYVSKDLRRVLGQSVTDGFSRTYCGSGSLTACRDALRQALSDALAVPASTLYDEDSSTAGIQRVAQCPSGKSDQWCFDSVRFRPIGADHRAHDPLDQPARPTNRPSRSRATATAATRARRARARCVSRSCRPTGPAPHPTASMAHRSRSAPAARPRSARTTSPSARRTRTATPAQSVGLMRLTRVPRQPVDPTDEADVNVTFSLTDVRSSSDLSDYTGQLQAVTAVRITDNDNDQSAGGGDDPATVTDFPFPATVPCAATPTPPWADMRVEHDARRVMPGVIKEGDRSIWQLGAVQVFDGGSDGLAVDVAEHAVRAAGRLRPVGSQSRLAGFPRCLRGINRSGPARGPGIPLAAAAVLLGISFGVVAEPVMGHIAPIVMSAIVFAGAAQFAATAVLADGGSAAAAIVAGILLNLRFIPMGISIAPSVRARAASRAAVGQGTGGCVVGDGEPRRAGATTSPYMLGATLVQYPAWVAGSAIGVLAGDVIGNPEDLGLDAIFPAFFLALLVNELRDGMSIGAALIGAALALALTPCPAGVPVLVACAGAALGLVRR